MEYSVKVKILHRTHWQIVYNYLMQSYLFLFLTFFSLLSCSTLPPLGPEWIVKTTKMEAGEARSLIESKKRFLELTFEQTKDLSFNTEKYKHGCLSVNHWGEVSENSSHLLLVSEILADKDFHIGFCPGQSESDAAKFVWAYCKRSKKLIEVRCFVRDCHNYPWKKLC